MANPFTFVDQIGIDLYLWNQRCVWADIRVLLYIQKTNTTDSLHSPHLGGEWALANIRSFHSPNHNTTYIYSSFNETLIDLPFAHNSAFTFRSEATFHDCLDLMVCVERHYMLWCQDWWRTVVSQHLLTVTKAWNRWPSCTTTVDMNRPYRQNRLYRSNLIIFQTIALSSSSELSWNFCHRQKQIKDS